MNYWMSLNRSRVLQQPSPKPLLVSHLVSVTPVIMRKQARVNPTGQQHNIDTWGASATHNEVFPVSVYLYTHDQGHIIFIAFSVIF